MKKTPEKVTEIEVPVIDGNVVDMEAWKAQPKTANKEPPKGDWLSGMELWSEFLVRNVRNLTPDWVVLEWTMAGLHPTGNVLLIPTKTPNDTKSWQWVDPVRFCAAHEFRGIVGSMMEEQEE